MSKYELLEPSVLQNEMPEKIGLINPGLTFYQKNCPHCGRENYSVLENDQTSVCVYCNNYNIRFAKSVLYEEEELFPVLQKTEWARCQEDIINKMNPNETYSDSGDFDTGDSWDIVPVGNSDSEIPSGIGMEAEEKDEYSSDARYGYGEDQYNEAPQEKTESSSEDRIKEEEESFSWDAFNDTIVFTAILHGNVTFEISPEEGKKQVLLGRSAAQAELLSQDGYTSNEHCYIFYRDNSWYVRNNKPRNGTFLNDILLQPTEERKLEENDLLKLGHHANSMQFRIGFK